MSAVDHLYGSTSKLAIGMRAFQLLSTLRGCSSTSDGLKSRGGESQRLIGTHFVLLVSTYPWASGQRPEYTRRKHHSVGSVFGSSAVPTFIVARAQIPAGYVSDTPAQGVVQRSQIRAKKQSVDITD
jgi:hypothetical protein